MSYKIAIASGKGGTGKTTVAVNLYYYIWKQGSKKIQLVDCDVEEPNDFIFFKDSLISNEQEIVQFVPEIDQTKCTFCRKCVEYCEFNAISIIPAVKFAEVNASLCHSCGACSVACQFDAIAERAEPIGQITCFDTGIGNGIAEGRLKIGSPMQTMVIKALKKNLQNENDLVLFDAPPGTSCSAVETVADSDFVVLVTEPTPFGLHDLKLMVELIRDIKKPFGVVINKAGLGSTEIYDYLEKEKIELLGEIPFSKEYAAKYASGDLFENVPEEFEQHYMKIIKNLERNQIG